METLKTLHAKIEKKRKAINTAKNYIKLNPLNGIVPELRETIKQKTEEKIELQLIFDNLYNKHN